MHVHARVRKLMVGVVLLDRALARNLEPQLLKPGYIATPDLPNFA